METMINYYDSLAQEFQRQHKENSIQQSLITILERENAALKSQNAYFAEEIKKLTASIMEANKAVANKLDQGKQNTLLMGRVLRLETSLRESKAEVVNTQREGAVKVEEMKMELSRAQQELDFLKVVTKDDRTNNLQLVAKDDIQSKHDKEIIHMLEENYEQRLEMMRTTLVGKQETLLAVQKENTSLRQTYDLKIHELRMKYEEQLLKVAQGSGGSQQVEQLRNKLTTQKKESDAEIAKLKAMISKR